MSGVERALGPAHNHGHPDLAIHPSRPEQGAEAIGQSASGSDRIQGCLAGGHAPHPSHWTLADGGCESAGGGRNWVLHAAHLLGSGPADRHLSNCANNTMYSFCFVTCLLFFWCCHRERMRFCNEGQQIRFRELPKMLMNYIATIT